MEPDFLNFKLLMLHGRGRDSHSGRNNPIWAIDSIAFTKTLVSRSKESMEVA